MRIFLVWYQDLDKLQLFCYIRQLFGPSIVVLGIQTQVTLELCILSVGSMFIQAKGLGLGQHYANEVFSQSISYWWKVYQVMIECQSWVRLAVLHFLFAFGCIYGWITQHPGSQIFLGPDYQQSPISVYYQTQEDSIFLFLFLNFIF